MDGIFSQRYEVIKIKRLLPSFHGQKLPCRYSDSWHFDGKYPGPIPRCSWMACKRGQSPRYLRPFRSSNNGKFPANAPLCPGRGGGGGAGVYIDWCIAAVSCPLDDHRNQQLINEGKFISSLTCNTSGSRKPTAVTRSSKHFGKKK